MTRKERLSQVRLSELKEGDKFYIGTKKNEVCQFVKKEKSSILSNYKYFWKNGYKECDSKTDKMVIYLRNIND